MNTDLHFYQRLKSLPVGLAFGLVLVGTLTGLFTFMMLTGITPIKPSEKVVSALLTANAVLVVLMGALVASQVVQLLIARRKGTAGAGLHVRLISLFSIVAVVPALLVAVFAAVTLNRGLDSWFSERTRAIVDTAISVAEAYQQNAAEATRSDLADMSTDIGQQYALFLSDRSTFVRRVARHAALRKLPAAFVFDVKTKRIETNVTLNDKIKFIPPSAEIMAEADKGEIVLIPPERGGNLVRALIKLPNFPSHYMYVYRLLSPVVVDQVARTHDAKAEYDRLMRQRLGVQLTFGLVFAVVALVFLLAAIWIGMRFSDRLVEPIVHLLNAARQVAQGKFDTKVALVDGPGDLVTLSQTFNMMTDQVRLHRDQLVKTNELSDARRRFTEAMLAGVSAGVIGINSHNQISIVNRSALTLLSLSEEDLLGTTIADSLRDMQPLLELALSRPSGSSEGQVSLNVDGRPSDFFVRITTERSDESEHGLVLTFDDITTLVDAQRNSAWADVARRIAHEIKNPLTPIQLSAERLKRKYLAEIKTDKHVFEQCTDTIIRQVGDLGRIVDEFSSFARMPKAVTSPTDITEVVQDATVLQRVSSADIDIVINHQQQPLVFQLDRRLVTQAVTNLVKNARESIETRLSEKPKLRGRIVVETGLQEQHPFIRVIDNGIGLPLENRHRLAEPYMTTREKGTGLGLAIVKRIMEEHGGQLVLADAPDGQGASVTLEFAELVVDASDLISNKTGT